MLNSMVTSTLILEWKYTFWANLVQKIESDSLTWNVVPTIICMCRNVYVHFLGFWSNIPFFGVNMVPKFNFFLFKVKFGTWTNRNIQNWMELITFFDLVWVLPVSGKFGKKLKIVNLSWSLVLRPFRIWRVCWWSFFYFWPEISLFGNFVSKISVVSSS